MKSCAFRQASQKLIPIYARGDRLSYDRCLFCNVFPRLQGKGIALYGYQKNLNVGVVRESDTRSGTLQARAPATELTLPQ